MAEVKEDANKNNVDALKKEIEILKSQLKLHEQLKSEVEELKKQMINETNKLKSYMEEEEVSLNATEIAIGLLL